MRVLITTILFSFSHLLYAQHSDHDHHDHEEGEEHHDHLHTDEIGISLAPTYYIQEGSLALGVHGHYVHRMGSSRFGLGVGFEAVFDDHKHRTLGAVFQYSPGLATQIALSPGIVQETHIEEGHSEKEYHWALHLEIVREFNVGKIDLGPFFEFALEEEGQHIGLGIHIGLPF